MASPFRRSAHKYEPLPRVSLESVEGLDLERSVSNVSRLSAITDKLPQPVQRILKGSTYAHYITPRRKKRSIIRLIYFTTFSILATPILLVLIAGIFFPSYTWLPAHYEELKQASLQSTAPGRANPRNEKVFIAASLYEADGELTSGAWGQAVLELVDLLGPENVYLSVYEDNPSEATRLSLVDFEKKVTCNSSIVAEDFDLKTLPRVQLPNGETRIKRIAFLAEVRNRALAPIDSVGVRFDRVLYINDVIFKPIEAAQLLFSTNIDSTGRANYGAACAVDFINAFKFYDRFATRDMDGNGMGIPFFPWFTSAGNAISRKDVINNSDAVRVRSCWGGMTAFEASQFQDQNLLHGLPETNSTAPASSPALQSEPLRFRYENATFWESSECCLINADIQYRRTGQGMPEDSGIYMNPYIRVAYDTKTLSWLSLVRRPEGLYSIIHDILNHQVGFPKHNERQYEEPGHTYKDTTWVYDDPVAALGANATNAHLKGHYEEIEHVAQPGGYCGGRQLLVINENKSQGNGKWGKIFAPAPPKGR